MIGSEYYNSIVVLPFILQDINKSAEQPVFIGSRLEMSDCLLVLSTDNCENRSLVLL